MKEDRKKIAKEKKKERSARLPPAHLRDASPLIAQIYALDVTEWKGTLNGQGRQQRKLLQDRYASIKKARTSAGLETPELIVFDPEAHEARASKEQLTLRAAKAEKRVSAGKDEKPNTSANQLNNLPPLPEGNPPTSEELEALGLPGYQVNFASLESELMEAYNGEDACEEGE